MSLRCKIFGHKWIVADFGVDIDRYFMERICMKCGNIERITKMRPIEPFSEWILVTFDIDGIYMKKFPQSFKGLGADTTITDDISVRGCYGDYAPELDEKCQTCIIKRQCSIETPLYDVAEGNCVLSGFYRV